MDTSLKPVLENGLYVPILAVVAPETPQGSAAAGADRASPQAHIGTSKMLGRGVSSSCLRSWHQIAGIDDLGRVIRHFKNIREGRLCQHDDPPAARSQARYTEPSCGVGEHRNLLTFRLSQFRHLTSNQ